MNGALLDAAEAGGFVLFVTADKNLRRAGDPPTYYGDATSLALATPLMLEPGEHREALEIKLQMAPSFCVNGKVAL